MSTRTLNLTDNVYDYLLSVSLREPEIMQELRKETAKLPMAIMQISPEQGQFMALLAELIGTRKALEIGTFTGYSALAVARVLPEDGKIIACDTSKEWTDMAQRYWKKANVENKIHLHLAPALETLDHLIQKGEAETFDFIFIDADKSNYPNYYERSLTLLRRGGLILVDNTLREGAVADPNNKNKDIEAIRLLNKTIHTDKRVSMSMIPLSDGVTLARKR